MLIKGLPFILYLILNEPGNKPFSTLASKSLLSIASESAFIEALSAYPFWLYVEAVDPGIFLQEYKISGKI
jgi:hypothetical protein